MSWSPIRRDKRYADARISRIPTRRVFAPLGGGEFWDNDEV
jgi:hypothetical protein